MFKRFSTQSLIIIAGLAGLGIVIKPIVSPLSKMISMPLVVPGGSFAGGLYMMWLVLAVVIVKRGGSGTLYGFLQALLVMVLGLKGNQGMFSIISYTLPGVMVDLVFWLVKRPDCIFTHMLLCSIANMTGALMVAIFFFHHPLPFIAIILGMSFVSGLLGGWLSHSIYKTLERYELI